MDLKDTPLHDEIKKIINSEEKKVFHQWECYFRIRKPNNVDIKGANVGPYIKEEEKDDIYRPLKITNIDFIKDYQGANADEGSINLTIGLGMWYKILQPYRDYLEIVIKKIPQHDLDKTIDMEEDSEDLVFLAIPKLNPQTVGEASRLDRYQRVDLDIAGVIDVEFQLLDLSMEKMRAVTVGGIFRKTKNEDVVKALLAKQASEIKIADDGLAVEGIKIIEADNQEEREHTVIPQGTPICDLPLLVHRACGGLYSTGINMYLQDRNWYVYPLYNTDRFEKEDKTLTVFKIPNAVYDEVERTYRMDGDRLICMATSDSFFDDHGDVRFKESGNGIRFADARMYMQGLVETKDNKAIAKRDKLNHEFLFKEMKVGDELNNFVQTSVDNIHANPFNENSKLAYKEGNVYSFIWRNSDDKLLYPGMPAKILYLKNGEIMQLNGVLLKVHHTVQMLGQAITATNYRQQTALFIYANKAAEEQ